MLLNAARATEFQCNLASPLDSIVWLPESWLDMILHSESHSPIVLQMQFIMCVAACMDRRNLQWESGIASAARLLHF